MSIFFQTQRPKQVLGCALNVPRDPQPERLMGADIGMLSERVITSYEEAGLVYWTMGAPLRETALVNRCRS